MSFGSDDPGGAAEGIGGNESGIGGSSGVGGMGGNGDDYSSSSLFVGSPVVSSTPTIAPTTYTAEGLPILSDQNSAADNYSQVTLALWDDFQKNYAPYNYQMMENLTTENPAIVGESVAEAQNRVNQSFDVAKNNRQVTMSRLGMAPDAQTQKSIDRNSALEKATAMAGAANTTRANLKERDMLIMTGGIPNVAGRSYGMSGE